MTKNRLIAGVALIVVLGLVGAIAAFVVDQEQSPETVTSLSIRGKVVVEAYHYDEKTGTYVLFYRDESSNLMVNIGFDWVEDQLGDSPDSNPAKWISLSLSSSSPVAGWTQIPTEIAADGLSRASGTYSDEGTGAWNIVYEFTASATLTDVQLTGLQSASSGDGNLVAAKTFTPVTLNNGDKLTITWILTLV
jgi:hypothetical protein